MKVYNKNYYSIFLCMVLGSANAIFASEDLEKESDTNSHVESNSPRQKKAPELLYCDSLKGGFDGEKFYDHNREEITQKKYYELFGIKEPAQHENKTEDARKLLPVKSRKPSYCCIN